MGRLATVSFSERNLLPDIDIHCNDFDSHIGGSIQSSCSVISFDESVYHSLS